MLISKSFKFVQPKKLCQSFLTYYFFLEKDTNLQFCIQQHCWSQSLLHPAKLRRRLGDVTLHYRRISRRPLCLAQPWRSCTVLFAGLARAVIWGITQCQNGGPIRAFHTILADCTETHPPISAHHRFDAAIFRLSLCQFEIAATAEIRWHCYGHR